MSKKSLKKITFRNGNSKLGTLEFVAGVKIPNDQLLMLCRLCILRNDDISKVASVQIKGNPGDIVRDLTNTSD